MLSRIRSHVMANGMVLVGQPMTSVESAAFTFLVPAGCSLEAPSEAGLATLTCELMLRGAGTRDSRALVNDLEVLGVERAESVGVAQASFSAATLRENLAAALDIFSDLLRRPHLPDEQLEASKLVCLQELRSLEDEPGHKLIVELRRRRYPDPWGRSSHGSAATIESLGIQDVRSFHAANYQPQGTILAVAGNFAWQPLCDQVERLFGDWPAQQPLEKPDTSAPALEPHIPHDSQQCHLGIAYPTIPFKHADYFKAWAAVGVLSGGMSSRLFTEVREKRGLCYTVHASLHTQRDRASVLCYAGTTAERAQETLDVTLQELIRLGEGIQKSELDRLKARIKSSLILQQESTTARSGALAGDWYHLGRARSLEEVGRLVDELTSDGINAFLRDNPPQDFTFVTLGPRPLEVPLGVS